MRENKAHQTMKLHQIRQALHEEGLRSLDQQAAALGLPRSTTWFVISASHKGSGLSSRVIKRMMSAQLPAKVHAVLAEYIEEKIQGRYGHTKIASKKFIERMQSCR